jgi:hypothetical protein
MWETRIYKIAVLVGLIGMVVGCVPPHKHSIKDDGEKVLVEVLKPDPE